MFTADSLTLGVTETSNPENIGPFKMKYPEDRQGLVFYYIDDETEKAERMRRKVRRFWVGVVPLTGLTALVASLVMKENIFFGCWLVLALVVGCWDQGRDE